MKKFILLLSAILLPCIAFPQQGTVVQGKIASEILGVEKEYSVYLPAGYDSTGQSYPVLYLLHGASDTHTAWAQRGNMRHIVDRLTAEGMALPMIVVMPDASGEGENHMGRNMGYFDRPGWMYERHFFDEFIPYIESTYRIKADKQHRAVAALSMGGRRVDGLRAAPSRYVRVGMPAQRIAGRCAQPVREQPASE